MLTRHLPVLAGLPLRSLALLATALLAIGCEKVPLLAPTGSTITLTTATNALSANGAADIVAYVLESSGVPPHSGTEVTFTTTLGTLQPATARTDVGGRVTIRFVAGGANGTATISAASGGATTGTTGALRIAVGAAAVGGITVSSNPTTVSGAGGTAVISATVVDLNGNLLPGVSVSFSTDAGTLSASPATTDSNGRAQTTLTTNRTAKVTATAGVGTTTGGTTPTTVAAPTATVTVGVNTTQTITAGTPTPSSPIAGQTVSIPLTYGTTTTASLISQVRVNWGDGSAVQTFSGQPTAVSHAFSSQGSYLVQISGVDSFGDSASAFASITVAARPVVAVQITPPTTVTAGTAAIYTISATATTGNSIASIVIEWDCDVNAGTCSTAANTVTSLSGNATTVQHTYQLPTGIRSIRITARDTSNAFGTSFTAVVVN